MKNKNRISRFAKVALLMLITLPFAFGDGLPALEVGATPAGVNITGHVWSSNIGWIKLQGDQYGIQMNFSDTDADPYLDTGVVDSTNKYAWSSNVGWIDFAPTTGYPSPPNNGVQMDASGNLTGWARVCSVFAAGCSGSLANDYYRGGWDGWIKMSGPAYGPSRSACNFNGYAWGSDVVGWIKFDGSSTGYGFDIDPISVGCEEEPITNFDSSEDPIDGPDGATLTWDALPGYQYRVVNDWLGGPSAGTLLTTNSQLVTPPNLFGGTTTYEIQSVNEFGDLGPVESITVMVEYALTITCDVFPTTIDDSQSVTVDIIAANGYTPPADDTNPQYTYSIFFTNAGTITDSDPVSFGPTNNTTHQWDNISFAGSGELTNEQITIELTDGSGRTATQTCAGIVNFSERQFQEVSPQ